MERFLEISPRISQRSMLKVLRRPMTLLLSLVQPMMWMLFFGFLFHRFPLTDLPPGTTYLSFLLPGICCLTVLTGASQSGIEYLRDMQTGFLQRMLNTGASPYSLAHGKLFGDAARLVIQAALVGILGLLLGARVVPMAFVSVFLPLFTLVLFGAAWSGLSCVIALKTRSQETMASFVHIVNMPLFFTSTALVPSKQMPAWLATLSDWNPLTLVVDSLRRALLTKPIGLDFWVLFGMAIFAAATFYSAARALDCLAVEQ